MTVPFRDRSNGELVNRPRALELIEKYLREENKYLKIFPASWGFKCILPNQRPEFIKVKMKGSDYKNFSYSFSETNEDFDKYIHVADFDETLGFIIAYETEGNKVRDILMNYAYKLEDCYIISVSKIRKNSKLIDYRF